MKSLFVEKVTMLVSIIGTVFLIQVPSDTIKPELKSHVKVNTNKIVIPVPETKPKTLIVDSIIQDAKATVEAYNESVREKNKVTKTLLSLTKKELSNTKETEKLIKLLSEKIKKSQIANKNNSNNNSKDNSNDKIDLKIDSACSKSKKSLFGKERCLEWDLTLYVMKKGNKEIIHQFKTK